jgi:hypothetical protein
MDNLSLGPLTQALNKAGFAAGTTTTYSITANPLIFSIKGKEYTKATVTNGATPTTDFNTGLAFLPLVANQGSVFVFAYDSAGNVRAMQGQIQALDVAGNFILAPQFPAIPDGVCPFGYLVVRGASNLVGTWTLGANNLSGVTGMTYAFVDLNTLPDRPQVS